MPIDENYIPYGKQQINEEEIAAVIDVLKSDYLTQGPAVPKFEQAVADYCHASFGIAVNSATSALHIACLALEVGVGDCVWTSATTFVASSNCALYCGAEVDFVDIEPDTFNIDAHKLERKLKKAKITNCLPRVVIVVHMCGQPCDMKKIHALSKEYGFKIIEDAAHAIGSNYQDYKTGSSQFSDITTFSFHPVKVITTAEGGMAVTNDKNLADKMRLLRSHGITRNEDELVNEPQGEWYYEQLMLGFNYRMTELQAALGLKQLARLDEFIASRNKLARKYDELFSSMPLQVPHIQADRLSSFHLYVIRLKLDEIKYSHRDIFAKLRAAGIGVNLHYMPVYLQPYYKKLDCSKGRFVEGYCVEAEKYASAAISIPLYPSLTITEQERVVTQVKGLICQ